MTDFEIENIIDIKLQSNEIYLEIKWSGYPNSENTWEPYKNINSASSNIIIKDLKRKFQYNDIKFNLVLKLEKLFKDINMKKYIDNNKEEVIEITPSEESFETDIELEKQLETIDHQKNQKNQISSQKPIPNTIESFFPKSLNQKESKKKIESNPNQKYTQTSIDLNLPIILDFKNNQIYEQNLKNNIISPPIVYEYIDNSLDPIREKMLKKILVKKIMDKIKEFNEIQNFNNNITLKSINN